jgi:hypothetical protein
LRLQWRQAEQLTERGSHGGEVGGAERGLVDERLAEQTFDALRDDGAGRTRLHRAGGAYAVDQFVKDGGERIDVAAVVALARSLLRGAIAGFVGRVAGQLDLGSGVIEDFDLVAGIDEDPGWRQHAVSDARGGVGGVQDGGDALAEGQRALPGEAALLGVQTIEAAMGGRVLDDVRRVGCDRWDLRREHEAGEPRGGGDDPRVLGPDVRRGGGAVE